LDQFSHKPIHLCILQSRFSDCILEVDIPTLFHAKKSSWFFIKAQIILLSAHNINQMHHQVNGSSWGKLVAFGCPQYVQLRGCKRMMVSGL
jgi:hypothetical protein